MSIFDDISREGVDPPHQDEALFAYLNRSNRIEAARVRQLVDEWFDHYPTKHRDGLIARFRSAIDDQHKSAFFELLLHEFVLAGGHKVVAIEPKLEHTTKSPDFLVESAKEERFYLEAVVATGRSKDDAAAHTRLNQALAAIDKISSPAHFLDLTVQGVPSAPVSINKLKRCVQTWIAALPEDARAKNAVPFIFEEHGVHIGLRAWPRHNRENGGRAIGVRHFPVQQVSPNEDAHTALKKKATRYGVLDHPFVVALNVLRLFHREENVIDALLGSPKVVIKRTQGAGKEEFNEVREANGIWFGPNGPRGRRLSAVLSFDQIDPWNFAARHALLIRNPWATAKLPLIPFGTDELNPNENEFERTEGNSLSNIFDLSDGWPGN